MPKNKRLWFKWLLALAGALAGLFYWMYFGCNFETCPIRSVWYYSTLWGFSMGYLIGDLVGSFLWRRAAENE